MSITIKNRFTNQILLDVDCATLVGADLSRVSLVGADLFEANLSGADLSGDDLSEADLSGSNLYRANLSEADLFEANLSEANLYGANLYGADLSRANLSRAKLSRANLSGANLSGANLSGAIINKKWCCISISPIGSENGNLWTLKEDGILYFHRGCFKGTEKEFKKAIEKKHKGTKVEEQYLKAIEFIHSITGE